MANYYSQHGEDFILDQMFAGKVNGFFVEVGCIDGKRFSNTLHFEQKGWTGICIEAHPDYISLLKENRPHSIICHCAVGEADKDNVVFYANKRGSLSTLDASKESAFRENFGEYFHGFEDKQVPMKRLSTIFQENAIKHIDILSIDIEGYEVNALKGLDFSIVKPLVMVIEVDNDIQERDLDSILLPEGYIKSIRISNNVFFVLDSVFHQRIKGKTFVDVKIMHTRHPLDIEDDQVQLVTITTQPENLHSPKKGETFKYLVEKLKGLFS